MGTLPQALEIIFEVERKRSNEKLVRRKINFPTCEMCVFFFFGPLVLSKLLNL
jgi:hypothetical protein